MLLFLCDSSSYWIVRLPSPHKDYLTTGLAVTGAGRPGIVKVYEQSSIRIRVLRNMR